MYNIEYIGHTLLVLYILSPFNISVGMGFLIHMVFRFKSSVIFPKNPKWVFRNGIGESYEGLT